MHVYVCNQREVAPAGAVVSETSLLFKVHASSAEGGRCVGVRVERIVCWWLPLLTRTAFINLVMQGGWGGSRSDSPDLGGVCGVCERAIGG